MRRYYRAKAPQKTPYRQPVYTGRVAGRVTALNPLIPPRKDPK